MVTALLGTLLALVGPVADDGAGDGFPVRGALALFGAVTALLAAFLAVIVVLHVLRRRRQANRGRAAPPGAAPPDAWTEAGRRAEAFPHDSEDDRG